MTTVNLYNGEVTIEFDELEHIYYKQHPTKGPSVVPGVTTPLSILNKPLLVGWAANQAIDYIIRWWVETKERGDSHPGEMTNQFLEACASARREWRSVSQKAANVGSRVHDFAERTLSGESVPIPTDPQVAAGCRAFLEWYGSHRIEPIHVERIVFSRQWYYCGTVDFYGKVDGELCVVDFKASSGIYPEYVYQLAGYAQALDEEFNKHIDVGWVVRLDKKTGIPEAQRFKLVEHDIDGGIIRNYKEDFVSIRQLYISKKGLERNLDALRKKAA